MKNVDRIVVDHINNRWEAYTYSDGCRVDMKHTYDKPAMISYTERQSKSYDILFIDADSLKRSNGGRLPSA